jgi:alkaline phosphatase D
MPQSDFTAKALLEDLPAGQDIFYRIRFQDHSSPTILSEPVVGRFRTASTERRSVSFTWGGDVGGQGWGIDEARGGMRTFATMRRNRPDFFIHSGDTIYADVVLRPEVKLEDGSVWRNIVTEAMTKAAETLDEFRGHYKYNLTDKNVLAMNAEIPVFAQWDDHEVTNNWWPEEPLSRGEHQRKNYIEKNMLVMAARGARAFHEYMPIRATPAEPARVYRKLAYGPLLDVLMIDTRSYRGPNAENMEESYGPSAYCFGPQQVAWLKRALKQSRAEWKVIACDMPLALPRTYDGDRPRSQESLSQGDHGAPRGREQELADILSFIKRERIVNTIWVTADVHYAAAHYFDPNKASFQEFEPFWEFVAGPLNAGTGRPIRPDGTFGPQIIFEKGVPRGNSVNHGPSHGMQFFGHVVIDGATGVMSVALKDMSDTTLWSIKLDPKKA